MELTHKLLKEKKLLRESKHIKWNHCVRIIIFAENKVKNHLLENNGDF